jgi:hypothetical protein
MSRRRLGPDEPFAEVKRDLAEKLADELRNNRDHGQPIIYEKAFRTGKLRVNVIWDAWDRIPLQERTATMLRAYELAEGRESRDRIALASGLTVPEAHAAGMLPYQIIAALRKGDPLTPEDVRRALVEEGGSQLFNPFRVQLRFASQEEAEAARQRLINRFPKSEEVWIIDRDVSANEYDSGREVVEAAEE